MTAAESTADELEKLARLRERGVLTEAEFQEQKRAVLQGSTGHSVPVVATSSQGISSRSPQLYKPKASRFATSSLVFGILGFVPLLGVIFGFIGLSQIKRRHLLGKGRAVAGIVLSIIWMLAIAGAGIIEVTGAANSGLPDGATIAELNHAVWQQLKDTGSSGFSVQGIGGVDCVIPNGWSQGHTFQCFVNGANTHQPIGEAHGTILQSTANDPVNYELSWHPYL